MAETAAAMARTTKSDMVTQLGNSYSRTSGRTVATDVSVGAERSTVNQRERCRQAICSRVGQWRPGGSTADCRRLIHITTHSLHSCESSIIDYVTVALNFPLGKLYTVGQFSDDCSLNLVLPTNCSTDTNKPHLTAAKLSHQTQSSSMANHQSERLHRESAFSENVCDLDL